MLASTDERLRADKATPEALPFTDRIALDDVRFRYSGAPNDTLNGISLSIPKNASIAFVGPTGVGKTTLIDIILGLLEPGAGRLTVDGTVIDKENVRAWRRNVGYVPQMIYLADDTIRRNGALGVAEDEINGDQLRSAMQAAHLTELVYSMPDGLN